MGEPFNRWDQGKWHCHDIYVPDRDQRRLGQSGGGAYQIDNGTIWQLTVEDSDALFEDLGIGDDGTSGTVTVGGINSSVALLVAPAFDVGHATSGGRGAQLRRQ